MQDVHAEYLPVRTLVAAMSTLTRTAIDRAGVALAKADAKSASRAIEQEAILDKFRQDHLAPLTSFTIRLQEWLSSYGGHYYVAQRLKRKPQIVRKLQRLSVRLTQLQDIAGARIVVKTNRDVDRLYVHLKRLIDEGDGLALFRVTDYRQRGRDESGYRAMHFILKDGLRHIELQIRSEAQHYWAEQIERTSVIYGYHLKEQEGDPAVIEYFRLLSDVFHELESDREPTPPQKLALDKSRVFAEEIIRQSDRKKVFDSSVNEGVVKAMIARQAKNPGITNWVIVFDWNSGSFVSWDVVDRDPELAMRAYVDKEQQFASTDGFEVVMVGSSDPAMIRHTHSHYFGIESYQQVLATLEGSVAGLSKRLDIGIGERQILQAMGRRKYWTPAKSISRATLKNHFCKSVIGFDDALDGLIRDGLVISKGVKGALFLNVAKKGQIEHHAG